MNKRHYEHTLPNIRGSLSNTYHGLALAREKLSSEEIQQQMKELGVEMEIVPLI